MPERRRHSPVGLGKLELSGVEGGRRSRIGIRIGVEFYLGIGFGIRRKPGEVVEEGSEVVTASLKGYGVVSENVELETVGGGITGDDGGGRGGGSGGGDEGK